MFNKCDVCVCVTFSQLINRSKNRSISTNLPGIAVLSRGTGKNYRYVSIRTYLKATKPTLCYNVYYKSFFRIFFFIS